MNIQDPKLKIQKQYPDFCIEVEALSDIDLRSRIVRMQQDLADSESHKETNEALNHARESVRELSGPYQDVRKAVKAKTTYILDILSSRGKV